MTWDIQYRGFKANSSIIHSGLWIIHLSEILQGSPRQTNNKVTSLTLKGGKRQGEVLETASQESNTSDD